MYKLIVLPALAFALILIAQSNGMQQSNLEMLKAQFLPAELSGMNFSANDARKILREKCRKVAGDNETIFLQANRGATEFVKCISSFANLTAIQEELEIAKPNGDIDSVFHKYCSKRSEVELCFTNLMTKIQPCLNKDERAHQSVMVRVATKLLGFVCYKGGDQIALFVAEEGPECLEANKENINNCLNASFSSYIPKNGVPDPNNLPEFVLGHKECKDVQDFEKCILYHLGQCNDITPLNIIESMFKFVKNETQCEVKKPKKSYLKDRTASGTSSVATSLTIITGALVVFGLQRIYY